MGRRIVDEKRFGNPNSLRRNSASESNFVRGGLKFDQIDTYFDRFVKYIPTDIIFAWVATLGFINSSASIPKNALLWIMFALFTLITAAWTLKQTHIPGTPPAITQTIISTGAFIVFAFAIGKPFEVLSFYKPVYGSILLTLYMPLVSFIIPLEG